MPKYLLVKMVLSLFIVSGCQSPLPSDPAQQSSNLPEQTTTSETTLPQDSDGSPSDSIASNAIDQSDAFSTTSPALTGNINHPELSEASGLAASTRRNNTLWAINDSGNEPILFALKHTGESIGSFDVDANNRDWEDLASAWINGESYLLIADIGDNQERKDEHEIHIVSEPLLSDQVAEPLRPVQTLRFRYPGGAHNSESMAVADGWIYILTKEPQIDGQRQASQVYRVPLDLNNQSQFLVAEKIANLAIPTLTIESSLVASLSGLDISQPTAFDIDAQNRYAYVLTYRSVYRYKRELNESWAQVLAKPRQRIHTHSLSQAEALAVDNNGIVWFTSEKRPAPLWAIPGR